MSKSLQIARELSLPLDFVTKTCAILAQRRKGKTYTASLIAEELVRCEMPWVALDPTGAWWGLRAGADGNPNGGLPVTILGGAHGDVPLERTSGRHVAELVIETPSWYILDLSLFETRAAERQFSYEFADALYRRKGQPGRDFPLHLFVDEADMFVPQERERDDNLMLGAFQSIVRRGGLRGLGTTLISQRPALVNKSVLVQLDMLVLLRLVAGNDQDYLEKNYVKRAGTAEQVADLMGSLAQLRLGEAWVWEPGADPLLFQRVQMRERYTFNSSATPKPGEKRVEPRGLVDVDLDALKEAMSETIERAIADDPRALRQQITKLRADLDTAINFPTVPVVEVREVEKIVEVMVAPRPVIDALTSMKDGLEGATRVFLRDLDKAIADLEAFRATPRSGVTQSTPPRQLSIVQPTSPRQSSANHLQKHTHVATRTTATPSVDTTTIGKTERNVLTVLVLHGALTHAQIALLSGYSVKASTIGVALGKLRKAGLVDSNGQPVRATEAGVDFLGSDIEPLPQGRELLQYWRNRFGLTEQRVLDALVTLWPQETNQAELAELTGYSATASTIGVALGKLRRVGVVDRWRLSDDFGEAIS